MSVKLMSMVYAAHFHDIVFIHKGKKKTGEEYQKEIRVLNSNLKSVCLALADHANDEGEGSYPGIDRLENKTELSRMTVIACMNGMKQEGIIVYTGRSKWNTCDYTINREKIAEMATWERQKREKPKKRATDESKATLLSEVKPLYFPSKATLLKPSIHPKPSFNEEEANRRKVEAEIQERTLMLGRLYAENFGYVTPLVKQFLRNAAIEYPDSSWYEPAFTVMLQSANHKSWNFVDTVLGNWIKHGFGWKPEPKKGAKHARKKDRKPGNPDSGGKPLSEAGQRTADAINKRRAAKKAAMSAVQ